MDINYKDFVEFYEFPMADFCRDQKVDVVLFPTAWIFRPEENVGKKSLSICLDLYQYWTLRMTPMINKTLQLKQKIEPRYTKE